MIVYVYMYYMLVRLSGCLNQIKGTIIIIIIKIRVIHGTLCCSHVHKNSIQKLFKGSLSLSLLTKFIIIFPFV